MSALLHCALTSPFPSGQAWLPFPPEGDVGVAVGVGVGTVVGVDEEGEPPPQERVSAAAANAAAVIVGRKRHLVIENPHEDGDSSAYKRTNKCSATSSRDTTADRRRTHRLTMDP
ncbi:MAG TPA: hypothetical protein VMX54_03230, partial [Vicinamibacteria bacterium]|nr:hypothetical protein [Vicinamibacteria bacterium]